MMDMEGYFCLVLAYASHVRATSIRAYAESSTATLHFWLGATRDTCLQFGGLLKWDLPTVICVCVKPEEPDRPEVTPDQIAALTAVDRRWLG